jgi:hypothetical protein
MNHDRPLKKSDHIVAVEMVGELTFPKFGEYFLDFVQT